jgi:hypothetical protein
MSDQKSALATIAEQQRNDLSKRLESQQQLESFDWKKLPPHIMSQVLMKKPYRGKANEPDYYLTPEQALVFAMRCFELGLSPLSSEVWFDRERWSVNVTLEGKLRLARERGNVVSPVFKDEQRSWRKGSTPLAGFTEYEPGILCTITVNEKPCSYMCWMSEWYVSSSPVWKSKPMHMLQIRAYDKALAFASGVGVSDMPSEREIQAEELPPDVQPMPVKPVPFVPQKSGGAAAAIPVDNKTDLEPILKASVDAANAKKP